MKAFELGFERQEFLGAIWGSDDVSVTPTACEPLLVPDSFPEGNTRL